MYGKTTVLRDLIRKISTGIEKINFKGLNVGLVDERGEIAAMYKGIPQNDVGIRTDVLDNIPKAIGMRMLIRSMSPKVISADEIGNENETSNVNIYAMKKTDGTAEYVSYNDCVEDQVPVTLEQLNDSYSMLNTNVATPFMGEVYDEDGNDLGYFAMREKHKELKANSYRKYTIVLWLEGTDLQCDNNILGGRCSLKVEFALEEYSDPVVY